MSAVRKLAKAWADHAQIQYGGKQGVRASLWVEPAKEIYRVGANVNEARANLVDELIEWSESDASPDTYDDQQQEHEEETRKEYDQALGQTRN